MCEQKVKASFADMAKKAWARTVGTKADNKGTMGPSQHIPGCFQKWAEGSGSSVLGCDEASREYLKNAADGWMKDWEERIKTCDGKKKPMSIKGECDIHHHLDTEECKVSDSPRDSCDYDRFCAGCAKELAEWHVEKLKKENIDIMEPGKLSDEQKKKRREIDGKYNGMTKCTKLNNLRGKYQEWQEYKNANRECLTKTCDKYDDCTFTSQKCTDALVKFNDRMEKQVVEATLKSEDAPGICKKPNDYVKKDDECKFERISAKAIMGKFKGFFKEKNDEKKKAK